MEYQVVQEEGLANKNFKIHYLIKISTLFGQRGERKRKECRRNDSEMISWVFDWSENRVDSEIYWLFNDSICHQQKKDPVFFKWLHDTCDQRSWVQVLESVSYKM